MSTEALLTGDGFSIPNMPVLVEGEERETVAQYTALSRLLPKPMKGKIMLVDLNAFESNSITLVEALKAMKGTKNGGPDIWLVVRSQVEPKIT
jgi:predicted metal-dependent RNase